MSVLKYVGFYFLEEIGGEHEITEGFVGSGIDEILVPYPFTVALVDEDYVFAYSEHGIHIVGVDDGCHAVLMGYVVE